MRILIACEFSGVVRDAFIAKGHDAVSCDLLPTERPGPHIQGDVLEHLEDGWDMMIAHPPCTYLSYVGTRHWDKPGRARARAEAMGFFFALYYAPIEKVCLENPLGYPAKVFRSPDQMVHPYYFGERQQKRTCLWLRGLKPLQWRKSADLFGPQTAVEKPEAIYTLKTNGKKIHWTEAVHGGKTRSKSWPSIAAAMSNQWG